MTSGDGSAKPSGRDEVPTGFDLDAISVAREDFVHGEYSDAIGPEPQEVDPVNRRAREPALDDAPLEVCVEPKPVGHRADGNQCGPGLEAIERIHGFRFSFVLRCQRALAQRRFRCGRRIARPYPEVREHPCSLSPGELLERDGDPATLRRVESEDLKRERETGRRISKPYRSAGLGVRGLESR